MPLALVLGIGLHRRLPLAAPHLAVGIRDHRRLPLAVFFIIPVVRPRGSWICNLRLRILTPASRHLHISVDDGGRLVLIPVIWLRGLWIVHHCLLYPVCRLLVERVVNLLRGIDRRLHGRQEAALGLSLAIDLDFERVVRIDDQAIKVRELVVRHIRRVLEVLLLPLLRLWALVPKDEVHLVRCAAPIGPEHDDIGCLVVEVPCLPRLAIEELHVRATASEAVLELHLQLDDEGNIRLALQRRKDRRYAVVLGLGWNQKPDVAHESLLLPLLHGKPAIVSLIRGRSPA
mmetsp:Transcript_59870/g.129787  ORF Transcript_59870/g.129787 Transcript_59870/m.129787 type:complete len:288 (+) Transcript_59870:784-1647(+)